MLRFILGLVGLGFVGVLLISFFVTTADYFSNPPEPTAEQEFHHHAKELHLASDGPLGQFDEKQLQRGFQVYKEVCAACHGLSLVAFRDLAALGYNEAEVKAIADQWAIQVPTTNEETGEAATRKAIPADRFPSPYPNEIAARAANNNANPPDLSLITKARHDGAAYIYSLLTGYERNQPTELVRKFPAAKTPQGLYYNPYFPTLNLAMPPPITTNGQVTYAPGNPPPSVDQMAKDVSAFLVWTAEPKLEQRHRSGLAVTIFLLIATIIGYFAYRNIWATHKAKVRTTGPLEPHNIAKTQIAKDQEGVAG
ncbi:MAG: cytochrome c1 [Sphingomonas sp.]|nr:cytochrome c1 [Sphingomonas sp.]